MHADALLACDGATLSALCGDDVALAELTSDVLEAVSEEALDLDHERKTLLKKLIQAAPSRYGGVVDLGAPPPAGATPCCCCMAPPTENEGAPPPPPELNGCTASLPRDPPHIS